MDKNEVMDESAKIPHKQIDDIRPDDGGEAGDVEADNSNKVRSQASGSGEMASGSARIERFERNNIDSEAENNSAGNQTIGIP